MRFDTKVKVNGLFYEAGEAIQEDGELVDENVVKEAIQEEKPKTKRK